MRRENSGDSQNTWYFLEDWDVPSGDGMVWTRKARDAGVFKTRFSGHTITIRYDSQTSMFTTVITD